MISVRVKTALAVILFISLPAAASWAQMPSKMDGDSAAIKQCVAAWEDAWNHTFLKDAHRTDTVKSIRFLTPEIASVDIDWQMTGAKTRDGQDAPNRKGLLTWIVTKQHNGQWMITIYHESAF